MVSTPTPVAQAAVPIIPANRTVEKPSASRTELVQAVKKNEASDSLREEALQSRFSRQDRGQLIDIRA